MSCWLVGRWRLRRGKTTFGRGTSVYLDANAAESHEQGTAGDQIYLFREQRVMLGSRCHLRRSQYVDKTWLCFFVSRATRTAITAILKVLSIVWRFAIDLRFIVRLKCLIE